MFRSLLRWFWMAWLQVACVVIVMSGVEAALCGIATRSVSGATAGFVLGSTTFMLVGAGAALVGGLFWLNPPIRQWVRAMQRPGNDRIAALLRAISYVISLAVCWKVVHWLTVWSFGRFAAADALGVLMATATVIALAICYTFVRGLEAMWLVVGQRRWAHLWTSGLRGMLVGLSGFIIISLVAVVVLKNAAKDYDYGNVFVGLSTVLCLLGAAIVRVDRRLPRLGQIALSIAAIALPVVGVVSVARSSAIRSAIASHGTLSGVLLRTMWKLSDRDKDGFASRFGGGDCNDNDKKISPLANDIPDNGIDENCTGGDSHVADMAHRMSAKSAAQAVTPPPNVILISVDALRADHLQAYGYARATSPNLAKLASRATVFEWAITSSPTTRRAVPSLMSGRYASTIAFRESPWPPVVKPGMHTMLAEPFRQAGYNTRAVHCCTTLFDKAAGVAAGIDQIDASAVDMPKASAKQIADQALVQLANLKAAGKPFFLWMHFIDPHTPYVKHEEIQSLGESAMDKYDGEIAYVDAQLGRIFDQLGTLGIAQTTIIAVTADHGEAFYEHGLRFHGNSLYSELTRIPLIVAAGSDAKRVAQPVSLTDVAPTLLELAGLAAPAGQNGVSLAATIRSETPPPQRMILSELIADRNIPRNLVAGYYEGYKLIWDLDANTTELFHYQSDLGDRDNLLQEQPGKAAELLRIMQTTIDSELSLLPTDKFSKTAGSGEKAKKKKSAASKPTEGDAE